MHQKFIIKLAETLNYKGIGVADNHWTTGNTLIDSGKETGTKIQGKKW